MLWVQLAFVMAKRTWKFIEFTAQLIAASLSKARENQKKLKNQFSFNAHKEFKHF